MSPLPVFKRAANASLEVDILTQWAFAALAIGLTISIRMFLGSWKCQNGRESDSATLRRWALRFQDYNWWMHMALPIYMIHEFEEHGIDLYGNRYSFQKALCAGLGARNVDECPATPLVVFFINVGTVWISGFLARFDALGIGLNFYGTVLINALVHFLPFTFQGFEYNPGVLTAAILFLPAAFITMRSMLDAGKINRYDIARALLLGTLVHLVIIASLKASASGYLNEAVVCILQILNILPLFSHRLFFQR